MDLLLSALVVLALDQVTKTLATRTLGGALRPARAPRWLRLVLNRRPPLSSVGARGIVALWVAGVLGALWVAEGVAIGGRLAHVGLGAAVGGATSNMVDLLRFGYVVDYIDLRVWPVFNLADVAIVAGALAMPITMALA